MTYEEAKNLKTFQNICNCGGYAASMNGRNPRHPHMDWCAQREEWEDWKFALELGPDEDYVLRGESLEESSRIIMERTK
jgi:hypothetical protein